MLFQVKENKRSLINRLFDFVADALTQTAIVLGMNYNQINIILYYLVIPLSWAVMIDIYISKPIASLVVVAIWCGISILKGWNFREWCDWLFKCSVNFLLSFNRLGSYYNLTSVIICVVVPLIIYGILVYLLTTK